MNIDPCLHDVIFRRAINGSEPIAKALSKDGQIHGHYCGECDARFMPVALYDALRAEAEGMRKENERLKQALRDLQDRFERMLTPSSGQGKGVAK